jgi:hypothetical protein
LDVEAACTVRDWITHLARDERKTIVLTTHHTAKHYRTRGLGKTARRIVELVVERGVAGATLLEVGGGVGDIQVELLKRGAVRATNLELSPAYEQRRNSCLPTTG